MWKLWFVLMAPVLAVAHTSLAWAVQTAVLVNETFENPTALPQQPSWRVSEGALLRTGNQDSLYVLPSDPAANLLLDVKLRATGGERNVFGVALRLQEEAYLLVRYYDAIQGLEVRRFDGPSHELIAAAKSLPGVERNRWLRMKVAAWEGHLMAKIWPDGQQEPDWQLKSGVNRLDRGALAIVGHDDTQLEVARVQAWNEHPELSSVRQTLEKQMRETAEKLKLAVVAEDRPALSAEGATRGVRIIPFLKHDRHPVAGTLTIRGQDTSLTHEITLGDYRQKAIRVELPEPAGAVTYDITLATRVGVDLTGTLELQPYQKRAPREYVRSCLDVLLEHGRDDYGSTSSPLFMAVLDADLRTSPSEPMLLDSLVRLEDRLHRRGERGSNPWYDAGLRRALVRMTELTGDDRYATAADDSLRYFFEVCGKPVEPGQTYLNGMPAWGTHVFWDCYRDGPGGDGDGNGPHEILVMNADWKTMWQAHSQGVQRAIDGIWQHHIVDKATGLHNRHDDGRQGCDFAFSGSSFMKAFAFMYHTTDNPRYLQQARTVASWHWDNRNKTTGLTADSPALTRRYDGNHTFSTVAGPHVTGLLEAYRLTGEPYFRDAAYTYVKAYDKYGWNEDEQSYWAMLRLDGTPVPERPKGGGYDAYAPYGLIDAWRTTIYSYEYSLSAAQAAVHAYETSVADGSPDPHLLQIAQRWGGVMERALPIQTGRRWKAELEAALPEAAEITGGYAEDYGRCISLFVHLYRATGEERYLKLAHSVADDAIAKLFHNGIFVGHPAKPYYETVDGVGLLLVGLLELDAPNEAMSGAL